MSEGNQLEKKDRDIAALQREVRELTDQNKRLTAEISLLNKELKVQATTSNVTVQQQQDKTAILWKGCARMPCGIVRPHISGSLLLGGCVEEWHIPSSFLNPRNLTKTVLMSSVQLF